MSRTALVRQLTEVIHKAGGEVIRAGRDEHGDFVLVEVDKGKLADVVATSMAFDNSVLTKLLKATVAKTPRMRVPVKIYLADDEDISMSQAVSMVKPAEEKSEEY